jgi:hypothetical protein
MLKNWIKNCILTNKDVLPLNSINSIVSSSDDDDVIFKALKLRKEV